MFENSPFSYFFYKDLYFRQNVRKISILVKTFIKSRLLPKNSKISISAKIYKNLDLRKNLHKSRFSQNFRKNTDFCKKKDYKKLVYRQNFR